jgi:hypothetical protein
MGHLLSVNVDPPQDISWQRKKGLFRHLEGAGRPH